ncbi:Gfo/Idh/MocA family oxidoreductase [Gammaproteobacteria bacterium]|nr:Gfo/Idh/MocA family oxidoreductase [Gammaproteobacteria bacterium]MDA8798626.1 Gfo/Idh/MocA family oxidoreductase [Gammaproteobacteria bacterium]MDC0919308.1 Gfo/Idh/MocA family oxidoreductase [Gammaproteobacteria bacterium]
MSRVKFAIVGCGAISKKHLACISQLEECALVGVCDLNQSLVDQFSSENGVSGFTDLDLMNETVDPDVFVVLTPSGSHSKIVQRLSLLKKHIIVEKPIALVLSDAQKMINDCSNNGSSLSVVKQNRFNKPVVLARELYDQNHLGNLFLGTVRVRWSRSQDYYDKDEWRGTWKEDGGVICNQAIHHIDMLQWFFGEVHSVFAANSNAILDIEAEDTSVAVVKFKSGAIGVIEASTAVRPCDLEGSISFLGNKGSIEIGGFAMNEIVKFELDNDSINQAELEERFANPSTYAFAHLEYYKNYIHNLLNGNEPSVSGTEAIKSLKIVHAIYKSHNENREIILDNEDLQTQLGKT